MNVEEFFKKYSSNISLSEGHYDYLVDKEDFKEAMIEFAKQEVTRALEAAYNNIEYTLEDSSVPYVVESSILNAYPLENIK